MSMFTVQTFEDAAKILTDSPQKVAANICQLLFGSRGPMPPRAWWRRVGKWVGFDYELFCRSEVDSLRKSILPMPRPTRARVDEGGQMAVIFGLLALIACAIWPNPFTGICLILASAFMPIAVYCHFREKNLHQHHPALMRWEMARFFWPITIALYAVEGIAYLQWERDERRWFTPEQKLCEVVHCYEEALKYYRGRLRCADDRQKNEFGHIRQGIDAQASHSVQKFFELVPSAKLGFEPLRTWVKRYRECLTKALEDAEQRLTIVEGAVQSMLSLYRDGIEDSPAFSGHLETIRATLDELHPALERLERYGTAYWLPGLPPVPRLVITIKPTDAEDDPCAPDSP